MNNAPLISIITVVYNDVEGLEKTILSVIEQNVKNYEFIVIDGNSVDGTLNVIRQYSDDIDIVISEPDKGLYDAMNKGLNLARGKWIYFLNSKDRLLKYNILQEVEPYLDEKFDVIHFNCKVTNDEGKLINVRRFPKNIAEIKHWPCIQHQSVFTKKTAIQSVAGFNLYYKILSDYDLFLQLYKNGRRFIFYKDIYVCNYNSQGLSAQKDNIDTLMNELKSIQLIHMKKYSILILAQLYFKKFLYQFPYGDMLINAIRKVILTQR